MKFVLIIIFILSFNFNKSVSAEDSHNHNNKNEKEHSENSGHDPLEDPDNEDHGHESEKEHAHNNKSHDHEKERGHEHGEEKFGTGKAIVEVKNAGQQFKLSQSAIQTLKIQGAPLIPLKNGVFKISTSSLVDFQEKVGVYKKKGDWFELVEVKIKNRGPSTSLIKIQKISTDDEIVTRGAALLRIAHLEASGHGGQGHGH